MCVYAYIYVSNVPMILTLYLQNKEHSEVWLLSMPLSFEEIACVNSSI